jgi:tRNA threonylcarbamoyladenosine biosynthesis protein TsaE
MEWFSVRSGGPEQTMRVASVLARQLQAGDVVLLTGGLASGKTTFVKGVAAALGSADVVTSPTFMLAQFYAAGSGRILHVDTYRLSDVHEYRDLALDDEAATSMTLVEWGERVAGEFPCHLAVEFEQDAGGSDGRRLSFSSSCDRWVAALPGLHREIVDELQ